MSPIQTRLQIRSANNGKGPQADRLAHELEAAKSVRVSTWTHACPGPAEPTGVSLALETSAVTAGVILTIRIAERSVVSQSAWLITPGILAVAALAPVWLRGGEFPRIGLTRRQAWVSLKATSRTCAVILPLTFLSVLAFKLCHARLLLRPALPEAQDLPGWLFYEFMYVAVAEEVFFRGYLQGNVLRVLGGHNDGDHRPHNLMAIVVSAACFAVAHVAVQGQLAPVVTFVPGLVLGWLFIRTQSLLAPILFHGIANAAYCAMVWTCG